MLELKLTDKVKCKLFLEEYDRYVSGGFKTKTYVGKWENVLNTISSNHSYGWQIGEGEGDDIIDECTLLDSITDTNGDGCDFIIKWTVEKDGVVDVVMDNEDILKEEEHLVVDCD